MVSPKSKLFLCIFGKGEYCVLVVRTLGIGPLGGPLYITNIYSTQIVYLKCVIKNYSTLVSKLSRKVWSKSILLFLLFNENLPN